MIKNKLIIILLILLITLVGCGDIGEDNGDDIMFEKEILYNFTPNTWDAGVKYSNEINGIFYQGQNYLGNETEIFAYVGIPSGPVPEGGFPAIVLVHGGLGKAYPDWVSLWVSKGYVAIAPDFNGHMNTDLATLVENPKGGPRGYGVSPKDLIGDKNDSWAYQSVSNIIYANNILRNMDNVNSNKIGITGISWGSYLLGIAVGVDNRFAFAISVYGAGYLHEDYSSLLYEMFAGYSDDMLEVYSTYFDPAAYASKIKTPIFFVQGVNDFAFSPVQKQKTANLINKEYVFYSYREFMTHGQEFGSEPKELFAFAKRIVKEEDNMLSIKEKKLFDYEYEIEKNNDIGIKNAYLFWTTDDEYNIRNVDWYRNDLVESNGVIKVVIPETATYGFVEIVDENDYVISSQFYLLKDK